MLREKLAVLLLLGTSAFLATTALVRGAVERRTQRVRCEAVARMAQEGALTELSRREALLRAKLDLWCTALERASRQGGLGGSPADALARASADGLVTREGEAVLLVAPSGDVVAASGGLARDREALAAALRSGGLIGRSGPEALRQGLVPRPGATTIAASAASSLGGAASWTGQLHRVVVASEIEVDGSGGEGNGAVSVHPLEGAELPPSLARAASRLWSEGVGEDEWFEGDRALSVRVLEDALGRPAFLLASTAPMPDVGLVPAWAREALLWEAIAAFLAIAIALRFLDRRVLGPIRTIEERARQLARSEHGALGFLIAERGEIGQLVDALESMLVRVRDERSDLLRAALGEPDGGGAPPVGRDVRVTLERAREALDAVSLRLDPAALRELRAMADGLEKCGGDLARFANEHPDARFLAPFLTATADSLEAARAASLDDITAIGNTLQHVVARSGEARPAGVDVWDVAEAIEHAYDVARISFGAPEGLVLESDLAGAGEARIDRDRFTMALVQLIGHSLGELAGSDLVPRALRLRAYRMDGARFVVEVEDTGRGTAPEDLHLAFTGEGGASGGLVVARELCRDLGVSIGIASDGVGSGTTYKLRVPYGAPGAGAARAA